MRDTGTGAGTIRMAQLTNGEGPSTRGHMRTLKVDHFKSRYKSCAQNRWPEQSETSFDQQR